MLEKLKTMSKIIKFIAQNDHVWNVRPRPYPAIKNLPQWWKDIPAYSNEKQKFDLSPQPTVTVKRCVPTIEMLGLGYYVPLWSDLLVTQQDGFPYVKWGVEVNVLETWDTQQVNSFKIPDGYSNTVFKNLHGWTIKTPPGWSSIFLHPVGYSDLPFQVISGIVETDVLDTDINVPFVLKNNFEGLIEKGTPMFQVIPFKREKWNSEFEVKNKDQHFFDVEKLHSTISRSYYSMINNDNKYK